MATSESLDVSTAVRDGFSPFNGVECRKPLAIDGQMLIASNHGRTDTNIHKVTQTGGYCEGIRKGTVYSALRNEDVLVVYSVTIKSITFNQIVV